jgi:hypothetical protein
MDALSQFWATLAAQGESTAMGVQPVVVTPTRANERRAGCCGGVRCVVDEPEWGEIFATPEPPIVLTAPNQWRHHLYKTAYRYIHGIGSGYLYALPVLLRGLPFIV